jgi:hypothetical protein
MGKGKGKGKAKAVDETEGVIIDGKFMPFHEDHKPKAKLPKINKVKRPTSADDTPVQIMSKSTSHPTPKAAYLGSSSNPILVAVESKAKAKVLSPASSRIRPLRDRSPNRPSHGSSSRAQPRPAYRGAKKPNRDSVIGSSSLATDLDSPPKVKGKTKTREFPMDGISPVADRRVEKSSSFPQISPLASPTRVKHKRRPFPRLSPLSFAAKAKTTDSDNEDKDDDDDELGMDSDDDILTRGGPRPFPMSTQVLESIQQRSADIGEDETKESKKREDADDDDDDMYA